MATKTLAEPSASAAFVPPRPTIPKLQEASKGCTACDLYKTGTQTVFGEGPATARVIMVGEQPGNEEDLEGHPFVGPAGRVLDRALEDAGIDRTAIFVTNAVKHFKWEPRGKRRIHKKPNGREIRACRAWLDAEMQVVDPEIVVLLGATAAQARLGAGFRVTEARGQIIPGPSDRLYMATVHPSSILRARDDETRRAERARFTEDLRVLQQFLQSTPTR